MKWPAVALSLLASCQCDSAQWGYDCSPFQHYVVSETTTSPSGIAVSGADPELVDTYTAQVETCLQQTVDRSAFVVLVAPDWYPSPEECLDPSWGPQQLLPVSAPEEGCTQKGFAPSDECPCRWRGGIRCPASDSEGRYVLVETPNLLLYKDNLIRLTLNISDPWSPAWSQCATP